MQDFGNIIKRPDGSFVITKNGLPYHVPDMEGFEEEFAEVSAYAALNPGKVEMEQPPPPPAPPSPEELAQARIAAIKAELEEIDRQSIRPLRAIAKGVATDEDTDKLAELEGRAEGLRAELAELEPEEAQ
jgi:hypothetical protein